MSTDELMIHVAWFETAMPTGPSALGDPETLTWGNFASIFTWHRDGEKDGPNFVPARFAPEPNGQVHRVGRKVTARTAIALDLETHKKTSAVPPPLGEAMQRVETQGLAGVGYNSHSHRAGNDRYRIVLPLSGEIAPDLPAPEIMAEMLGLDGVLDRSKLNPASLFYLPSRPYDAPDDLHQTLIIPGAPIDAARITHRAAALLAARQVEADRIAAVAMAEAAARREAKIAAGFDPDDSLIEKLRSRFDLDSVLTGHGYDKQGTKYRHPNSSSGSFGADVKVLGGIERIYSHNGSDALHANNLPTWCSSVTALDVFDVVAILDFGGDRNRAMRELAERFNVSKAVERKSLSKLIFNMIRQRSSQEEVETAAYAEGERLGLNRADVISTAVWVVEQFTAGKAA